MYLIFLLLWYFLPFYKMHYSGELVCISQVSILTILCKLIHKADF